MQPRSILTENDFFGEANQWRRAANHPPHLLNPPQAELWTPVPEREAQ